MPGSVTSSRNAYNDSLIEWTAPTLANGRLEYYEVAVTQLRNDEIIRRRISLVNGTSCAVRIPTCVDSEYKTNIDVRAVNVAAINTEVAQDELAAMTINTDAEFYENNEDLRCLGLQQGADEELQQKYHNAKKYRIYRSDWYLGSNYNCLAVRLSRNVVLALVVVISGVGVMIGLYIARNIYNKMSDINCMLPPGLDYYLSKNGMALAETEARQSAEINNTVKVVNLQQDTHSITNEKHHLLAYGNNDPCYSDDSQNNVVEKSTPIPADYVRTLSQCSSDCSVGSSASTVEAALPLNLGNYIKPSELPKETGEQHEMNHCSPSHYVGIEHVNIPAAPASGYINAAQLQNNSIVTKLDYTTAEQLAKMNLDNTRETRISGYVTPGDLNALGQQQHRQIIDENSC